jgi:hypothetical protein
MPNDGIVTALSENDWARLCRRENCGNELPPAIGLPAVDEDINRRSGDPLFDPGLRPSSEEENSLWSTPQELAKRARQKLYAIAPVPVYEDVGHRRGQPFLDSGLSRSLEPNWQTPLMMTARRIVHGSVILFLFASAIATPLAYFWVAKRSSPLPPSAPELKFETSDTRQVTLSSSPLSLISPSGNSSLEKQPVAPAHHPATARNPAASRRHFTFNGYPKSSTTSPIQ